MKKPLSCIVLLLISIQLFAFDVRITPITNIKPYFVYDNVPFTQITNYPTTNNKKVILTENPDFSEIIQQKYMRYFNTPSFIDLGIYAQSKYVNLLMFMDLQQDILTFFKENQWTNIPYVGNNFYSIADMNGPKLGFLEFNFANIYASFGRRALKWGPATYDFAINDSAPFLDSLYLKIDFDTKVGTFWYNYIITGFNNTALSYPQNHDNTDEISDLECKTLFSHRFGWETNTWRVGISELNLIYNKTPSLLDATPLTFWHNNYQHDRSNVLLQISFEKLFQFDTFGFRLYGSYAQDDLQLGNESSTEKPNAMGFNLGVQFHFLNGKELLTSVMTRQDFTLREETFKFTGGLNLSYEWYWATAFLYNRNIDAGKFTVPSWLYNFSDGGYLVNHNAFFIGFPYGPDTMVHKIHLSYENNPLKAYLDCEVILKGAYRIETPYNSTENAKWETFKLNDSIQTSVNTAVGCSYALLKGLLFNGEIKLYSDLAHDKNAVAFTIGASIDPWNLKK